MPDTHSGGCHCGAVRFTAEVDLGAVIECNCSHCSRKGLLLSFLPRTAFSLDAGEDKVTEYRFNKHVIAHQFCKVCGVQPYAFGQMPDGTAMAAVNVRCLDDIDLTALDPKPVDGRSL